jgi:hypothetical protein
VQQQSVHKAQVAARIKVSEKIARVKLFLCHVKGKGVWRQAEVAQAVLVG